MSKQKRVAEAKSEIVAKLPAACSDETKAVEFMEATRWNGEPYCPHCGCFGVRQMTSRDGGRNARFLWHCNDCGKQFTVRVGTVFEDSRIPLRHWCYAFWAACSSKKGVSALQIARMTGVSYKSALFLMHRIRFAMADAPGTARALAGTVEVDETYVGGKPRNPDRANRGTYRDRKACLVGMLERGGELRPFHIKVSEERGVRTALVNHVRRDARLMTDESYLYRSVGKRYAGRARISEALHARIRARRRAHEQH